MAPQNAAPPSLAPSVEEAYRRKCVELKRRNRQVEDANHAARLRIARIKHQVEKLRVERAFLLEQLTKRTSTNVEDSEGSPSPPPTGQDFDFTFVNKDPGAALSDADTTTRKPKEKASRKRAHGKAKAAADGEAEAAGDNAEPADSKDEELPDAGAAPSSAGRDDDSKETLSRLSAQHAPESRDVKGDGELPGESEDPLVGAFNIFAAWRRDELSKRDKSDVDIRATLLAEWRDATASTKQSLADKFQSVGSSSKIFQQIRDHEWQPPTIPTKIVPPGGTPRPKDEDVEMDDGDTQKSEAPVARD